jgi:DNA invertase Pin-like site-specific DNA recombinase
MSACWGKADTRGRRPPSQEMAKVAGDAQSTGRTVSAPPHSGSKRANKLTVHILAAVAQHEREMIAQRTKDALQAAKSRGKRLGNPKLAQARQRAFKANREAANQFAANVLPVIQQIQASGVQSLRGVARALIARGIKTARGGEWSAVQVADILRRG